MKFKILNKERIACLLLSSFILFTASGCGKRVPTSEEVLQPKLETGVVSDNSEISQPETGVVSNNSEENKEVTSEIEPSSNEPMATNSSADEAVISYFSQIENEVDQWLQSDTVETIKTKSKDLFITFVDFLFYNGEIKEYTLNELTDSGAAKVKAITTRITTKISDKIGQDTYNNIIDSAHDIWESDKKNLTNMKEALMKSDIVSNGIEKGSDILNKGKIKVKDWYENFRN